MLTAQYGYMKLIIADGYIVIRNTEITEMSVYTPTGRRWERNIENYNPSMQSEATLYYNIPFMIGRCLNSKIIYKWDIYRELINFGHKTAYELYELLNDYIKYCQSYEGTNPFNFPYMRYCYIEGVEDSLIFIINILEAKFPSLRMEYILRKW